MDQTVWLEPGAVERVVQALDQIEAQAVFLVADEDAYRLSGAEEALQRPLTDRRVVSFSGFEPNPNLQDLQRGLDAFRKTPCDAVLAVGGGTAIDLAKLIAAVTGQQGSARQIIQADAAIENAAVPSIAVPTTAGTGSEATHFAVIYVDDQKYSVAHESLLPDYAIVDPCLTARLPPPITACTGLDALVQAIESIWSVNSTDQSRMWATQSLALTAGHLRDAVLAPSPDDRLAMSKAAHLAGKAINISLTTAPHAVSYILTSRYRVPHGCAVALTLAAILVYNSQVTAADCTDPRGPDHVRAAVDQIVGQLGCTTPQQARSHITDLQRAIKCPVRLTDVGVQTTADLQTITEQVNVQRLSNNPRRMTPAAITDLLRSLL